MHENKRPIKKHLHLLTFVSQSAVLIESKDAKMLSRSSSNFDASFLNFSTLLSNRSRISVILCLVLTESMTLSSSILGKKDGTFDDVISANEKKAEGER